MNVGISVSRVGGAAQVKAMKSVAGRLRLDLAQFRAMETFAQFASDLDAATQRQLARGQRTVEVLKQPQYQPVPVERQIVAIYAVTNDYLDDLDLEDVRRWERGFLEFAESRYDDVLIGLRQEGRLTEDIEGACASASRSTTGSSPPRRRRRWRERRSVAGSGAREVLRRIKSVRNTRKITRTMELVATSKLKRAMDRMHAARPYSDALGELLRSLHAPG